MTTISEMNESTRKSNIKKISRGVENLIGNNQLRYPDIIPS